MLKSTFIKFAIFLGCVPVVVNCKPRIPVSKLSEVQGKSDFLRCQPNVRGFALIVTGYAMGQEANDFSLHTAMLAKGMKARGYCVVALFSKQLHPLQDSRTGKIWSPTAEDARRAGVEESEVESWLAEERKRIELMHFGNDVAYFKRQGLLTEDRKATPANIDRFFASVLSADVSASSKRIFVSIGAHGHPKYGKEGIEKAMANKSVYDPELLKNMNSPSMSSDFCRGSSHECTLNTCKGDQESYDTNELKEHFSRAAAAGFQSWLQVRSCHSGGLRRALVKLPNLCFAASTIGFSPSHGCAEHDPVDNIDFTSTSEGIVQLLSAPAINEMKSDPYFTSKKCFAKYLRHARNRDFQRKHQTLYDMFWSARKNDQTWDHATLTSLDSVSYFDGNEYSVNLRFFIPLDMPRFEQNISQISQGNTANRLKSELLSAASDFQKIAGRITKLRQKEDEIRKKEYDSRKSIGSFGANTYAQSPELVRIRSEVEKIMPAAEAASKNFLKKEREFVEAARQAMPNNADDPCRRPL